MATSNFKFEDAQESIINRKRPLRGVSDSFSSNNSQRLSPSSPQDNVNISQKTKNRSVKSIIAWIEEASANKGTSRHSGDDIKSVHSVGTISSTGSNSSLLSRQTMPGAADVEEYSLTLLKYKQYYTDVPLGRCLDVQKKDSATETLCNIHVNNATAEASLLEGSQDDTLEFGMFSASTEHSRLSRHTDPVLVDDKETNSMNLGGNDGHLDRRSPQEVLAF